MSNGTIMIVEDEKDLRDVYSLILKHSGYDICEATNGKEALTVIEGCAPDLVLLDIFMPVMDGEQFLRQLDITKYPKTKIVVCSNTADNDLISRMIKLGAEKVVTKSSLAPTDLTELVAPYVANQQ